MRFTPRLLLPVLVLAMLVSASAGADTVTLKNGDRITGTVVRKEDRTLLFKTTYAGEIKIQWADVADVTTTGPVVVQLTDGTSVEARLAPDATGRIALVPPVATQGAGIALEQVAFINPTPEQSGKGVSYKRRINIAANAVRGNSDSSRITGEGEFLARAKMYRYRLWAQGTRASDSGTTTESNWRTTGDYDWFFRPKDFLYGRLSLEQDKFRDIKLRTQLGVGYGRQLIDTPVTQLSVQAGPNVVREIKYAGADETFPAAGWQVRYAQWLWDRKVQVYFDQDGAWNLETTRDVVIQSKTGLRVPVATGLSATTELKLDWDNDPAPGTKSTDTTLLFGLSYAW